MREKKMMNLINSMDPGEEDGEPIPGTSGSAAAAIIVEHGHCNPLDDTLVAQMHPVQPPLSNSSSSNICSVRVIRESHNNNSNRSHRKNKNKAGKKASVELLPIGSGSGSGGTEGDDGGYVNELALVGERQQSIDELIPVHQEAYRMEGDEEEEEEEEELAVDSDDSSQCDLQPNTSARRKL